MTKTYRNIPELTPQQIANFWKYVDKTPGQGPQGTCWTWKGGTSANGYGGIKIRQVTHGAHRVAFFLLNGSIDDTLMVLHGCDTRNCMFHLSQGTHQENMQDMSIRNRATKGETWNRRHQSQAKGEHIGTSKLTVEQVIEIRSTYKRGIVTLQSLAEKYGVDQSCISLIVLRKSWKHVE